MTEPLRQSVPTAELHSYYECGWAYLMPNFDHADHSIIEWLSDKLPVYPKNSTCGQQEEDAKIVPFVGLRFRDQRTTASVAWPAGRPTETKE